MSKQFFFLIPIVTHFLTVEEYGNVNFFLTGVEICTILITFGGQNYYRFQYFKDERDLSLILVPATLSLVIFCCLQILLVIYLISFEHLSYYAWLPLVGLFQSFCALMICKYQMQKRPLHVGAVNISLAIVSVITTVAFLYSGFGFSGRITSVIVTPIIIGFFVVIILLRIPDLSFGRIVYGIKPCTLFGAKSVLTSISWWLRAGMDRVIIQYVLGSATLGLYYVAMQLLLIMSVISLALNNSIMPRVFSSVNQGDKKELLYMLIKYFMTMLVLTFCFYIVSPVLFKYLLPPSYYESHDLLLPMLVGILCHGVFLFICNVLTAIGQLGILSSIALFGALAHSSFSILLAKRYGVSGIVWSASVSYCFSIVMLLIYLLRSRVIK
ncbi:MULTISPECIES: lipopolysaccharide biosynthesis protein [Symbiopectobacterium]|uniref:lipopolysaccharide biosynthesis protein n=1 Tax=Symbiopectobacterium TaxID=801 RepID=UPI00207AB434|nr:MULTISPECIES: oligosaccharide flippase family protein [Symbiopectobacterium]MBT9429734.1 oligosaccharide flippase family protein [Candidatus Symbiopectobacterium endolongispinus]